MITSFDDPLTTSLLATCNRFVVNKLSPAMRTHPDIGLLITSLLQDVNTLVTTRCLAVCSYLCYYQNSIHSFPGLRDNNPINPRERREGQDAKHQ